ncbi:hypothetical protein GCM10027403_13530 [Arthrobacter tecti]
MTNPLVPTHWELTVTAVGLLLVVLAIAAVVSLARNRNYTPVQRLLWLLVIIFAPIVGSVLWLLVGRRTGTQRHNAAA